MQKSRAATEVKSVERLAALHHHAAQHPDRSFCIVRRADVFEELLDDAAAAADMDREAFHIHLYPVRIDLDPDTAPKPDRRAGCTADCLHRPPRSGILHNHHRFASNTRSREIGSGERHNRFVYRTAVAQAGTASRHILLDGRYAPCFRGFCLAPRPVGQRFSGSFKPANVRRRRCRTQRY